MIQKTKPDNRKELLSRITESGLVNPCSVDFARPLPKTENESQHLLAGIENMSKWRVAQAMRAELFNALGAMKFVQEEIIVQFGSPKFILTDSDLKLYCAEIEDLARDQKTQGNIRPLITNEVMVLLSAW